MTSTLIAGYDFGMFRLEGELGYKRAKAKSVHLDDAFVTAFNAGAGTALTSDDFDLGGHASVLSGWSMRLLDLGGNGGIGGYVGGGAGYARRQRVRRQRQRLRLAAARRSLCPDQRQHRCRPQVSLLPTGKLNFNDAFAFDWRRPEAAVRPRSASNDKFRSHSLLASLTYNFGGAATRRRRHRRRRRRRRRRRLRRRRLARTVR